MLGGGWWGVEGWEEGWGVDISAMAPGTLGGESRGRGVRGGGERGVEGAPRECGGT